MKRATKKQKDFAKDFVLGEKPGNATEAALTNYNVKSRINARNIGYANMQKPVVQAEIADLLERHNLTDDFLMQRIKEGLDANVVTEYKGEVQETSVPDINLRHKYAQDMLKVKGLYAPERTENLNVNIAGKLESLSEDELKQMLKEILNEQSPSNRINKESKAGQRA